MEVYDAVAFLENLCRGSQIGCADESPEQWRERFEERAAIREYDGGQSREMAEEAALAETRERMRLAE